MRNVMHSLGGLIFLVLCGCSTYQITSDPSGARVLVKNKSGTSYQGGDWGEIFTPCKIKNPFNAFSAVGVVWPDGTGSPWLPLKEQHFIKAESRTFYDIAPYSEETPAGDIVLSEFSIEYIPTKFGIDREVIGVVSNASKTTLAGVMFTITGKDNTGVANSLLVLPEDCEAVPPGGSVSIKKRQLMYRTGQQDMHIPISDFKIQDVVLEFAWKVRTKLLNGNGSSFSDENILIIFGGIFELTERIDFTLKNLSGKAVSINWNKASYIDLSGTAQRVMHKGVKYSNRNDPQLAMVIPPQAKLSDVILPVENIYYSKAPDWATGALRDSYGWKSKPLFNGSGRSPSTQCGTISLYLPITIDGEEKNYTFTFEVKTSFAD